MWTCRHQWVKRGTYLRTRSAFYPLTMVTNEVCFPVYKPVDYTCNSSLIRVSWGRPLTVGIAQLAHRAGKSIFCCEVQWCGSSQKTLGMTCCQTWRISHGHNDNLETVLGRDAVTVHLTEVILVYGLSNSSNCNHLECPWRSLLYCKPGVKFSTLVANMKYYPWDDKLSWDHFLPCYASAVQAIVVCLSADMIKRVFLILMS